MMFFIMGEEGARKHLDIATNSTVEISKRIVIFENIAWMRHLFEDDKNVRYFIVEFVAVPLGFRGGVGGWVMVGFRVVGGSWGTG